MRGRLEPHAAVVEASGVRGADSWSALSTARLFIALFSACDKVRPPRVAASLIIQIFSECSSFCALPTSVSSQKKHH